MVNELLDKRKKVALWLKLSKPRFPDYMSEIIRSARLEFIVDGGTLNIKFSWGKRFVSKVYYDGNYKGELGSYDREEIYMDIIRKYFEYGFNGKKLSNKQLEKMGEDFEDFKRET